MHDFLVVGAGFAGATVASLLAQHTCHQVVVIDRRPHVGGNAFDEPDDAGILIHRYGPHIFHTNSSEVLRFLSQFTDWLPYEHKVLAQVEGKLVPIPINIDTVNTLYNLKLDEHSMDGFLKSVANPLSSIQTAEDAVVSRVGRDLYEKFFRNYTRKQWGLDPSELDASVTARIPVRTNHDDRYFTDKYQLMPSLGYTSMFRNMLNHPSIRLELGKDFSAIDRSRFRHVVYSGPIDAFFDYRYGKLPYRSLRFEHRTLDLSIFQDAAVINYPNDFEYTRVTEFKWLTGQVHSKTSIVYEYPNGEGDPYYPIPNPSNARIYQRYRELAVATRNVSFVGRLATYKYFNMDQVVAQALTLVANLTGLSKSVLLGPDPSVNVA